MTFVSDLKGALRLWRRRPAMPILTIAFLGCGMGAATGVFAVADAMLWRDLPLPGATRIVWVQSVDRGQPGDTAPGLVQAWIDRVRTLDTIGALRPVQGTWRDRSGTDRLEGAQVTAGALNALGLTTTRGRLLSSSDEQPGATPVVVLTHRLWRSRFASDVDVIGRDLELDGRGRTIVGVLSEAADQLPFGGDWFTPLALSGGPSGIGPRYLDVIGRLSMGASYEAAERELAAVAASVRAVGDDGAPLGASVRPLAELFSAGAARVLEPLLAAALVVLLIATGNTANLRLADQQQRRTELAVRAALGAGRGRLVAQLLGEALIVSMVAGALGLILAEWCIAGLQLLLPPQAFRTTAVHVDLRVALFMLLLVVVVTALSALVPALRHTSGTLGGGVLAQARGVLGGDSRLHNAFVVAQIALAMTLGAGGAVMVQTTRSLAAAEGAWSDRVWTAAIRLPGADFPAAPDIMRVGERLVERVSSLPGIDGVAIASRVPLAGGAPGSDVALFGESFSPGTDRQTRIRFVTPGYFEVIDSPVVEGRDFDGRDRAGSEPVVVVNETLAARLTPGRSPVGQHLKFAVKDFNGPTAVAWRIVGLVADARDRGPRQPAEPEVYVSLGQGPAAVFDWIGRQLLLVARATPGTMVSASALRTAVAEADPRVPAFDVQTLEARFDRHIATERLLAGLLMPLGAVGLALAGFGVFAVTTHAVHRRRREIALRMVLGAAPLAMFYETARTAFILSGLGMLGGLAGAAGAARLLQSVSFGTRAVDPATVAALAAALIITTAVAVWLPARRAARHDPALVLRAE